MGSALLYLGICITGYLVAIPLRKYKAKLKWFGTAQLIAVVGLVFAMGVRVGANEEIVRNLDAYGLYAAVFTAVTLAGSVAAIYLARRLIGLDRHGLARGAAGAEAAAGTDTATGADTAAGADTGRTQSDAGTKNPPVLDKMTIFILSSVCAGIFSGYFYFLKAYGFEEVSAGSSLAITIGLCILLSFVGLDLGLEGQVIDNLRRVGLKILILPVAVAAGTLAGALVCSLFLPLAANESLAVGAGFAWYSLGAAVIMDAGYEAAGAISFMHNVMRELCAVVFIPLIARKIGYVESISLPGSTGMDVCLPIVEQSTNGTVAVYSFLTGFVLSMSVPFLVPFFLSL